MFFQHVYDKTLAQASYFIGCQKAGVAAVIDPKRDIDTYLEIAKQNNMQITHIFETHIHADFLSGSRELAAVTGAKMYLSDMRIYFSALTSTQISNLRIAERHLLLRNRYHEAKITKKIPNPKLRFAFWFLYLDFCSVFRDFIL